MSKLVIVESPTKAKTISKFLGKGFKVESSFGHVRDLPKSKMGVDIEGGTFEPTYTVSKEKTKQVKTLKDLAKKADSIIFATDEDREGEAISWHLAELLDVDPDKAERIVFHEITKHAIEEALKTPRHIDQKLVDAQQARRILDRLVGYELSPLLWKKVARGLSAGRVQSVAVRLIVERERDIRAFVPDEYWTLEGTYEHESKATIPAKLHSKDGKKLDKLAIKTKEAMDTILSDLEKAAYTITNIEKKETKRTPPAPFITSSMQQAAHNAYGYSARQTMRLAQQLYEGIDIGSEHVGLITYMRTDSTNLSEKFLTETTAFVQETYGDNYTLGKARVYKKKAKGAQEAHEAIRPTDPTRTPESIKHALDAQQLKLYTLIWKRAVATQMADATLNKTNIDIESNTTPRYMFRASGQTIIFDGWLTLYPEAVKEEMLPELNEADALTCLELKPDQHFTKPPARYSDATLVKALEEHGIGRPSTYAPTIGTIENRGYVFRNDDKRLEPNDIAFVVNDLLVEHFSDIVDLDFTATMEQNLDEIAEGKHAWKEIIKNFYEPFHKNLEEKTEHLAKDDVIGTRELGVHPTNGKPISVRVGRYGPYVQCGTKDDEEKPTFASLDKGMSIETITLKEALTLLTLPRSLGQDEEGNEITANKGRFGPYVKAAGKFYSLKEISPYTVTLEQALEVIAAKKKADAEKIIKVFKEEGIEILNGRYGPYVTDGEKNARVPKDLEDPAVLTLEDCQEMLKNAKPSRRRKKAPAKKKK